MSDSEYDSEYGLECIENYESGPFCEHFSDPYECDMKCKCGHTCAQHEYGDCSECDCTEFEDTRD